MGLYFDSYSGPVLLAKYKLEKVVDPYFVCDNQNCSKYKNGTRQKPGNFCVVCGSPIVEKTDRTMMVKKPSYQDIYEDVLPDDALCPNDHVKIDDCYVFVPNASRNRPRSFRPEQEANNIIEIEKIDVEAEKKWFAEAFAAEIAALTPLFEEVRISWVFMSYKS